MQGWAAWIACSSGIGSSEEGEERSASAMAASRNALRVLARLQAPGWGSAPATGA